MKILVIYDIIYQIVVFDPLSSNAKTAGGDILSKRGLKNPMSSAVYFKMRMYIYLSVEENTAYIRGDWRTMILPDQYTSLLYEHLHPLKDFVMNDMVESGSAVDCSMIMETLKS